MSDAYKRFVEACESMRNPVKDTSAYKYNYATLQQVQGIVDTALYAHGLKCQQYQLEGVLHTEIKDIETGEVVQHDTRRLSDGNDQARGSSETYQRRYAQLCVCGLTPVDDDGQAAVDELTLAKNELKQAIADVCGGDREQVKALGQKIAARSDREEQPGWYKARMAEVIAGTV